jgi:hypothetical protein
VDAASSRWLPARLMRRWGFMFWLGPLLGFSTGLFAMFLLEALRAKRSHREAPAASEQTPQTP